MMIADISIKDMINGCTKDNPVLVYHGARAKELYLLKGAHVFRVLMDKKTELKEISKNIPHWMEIKNRQFTDLNLEDIPKQIQKLTEAIQTLQE